MKVIYAPETYFKLAKMDYLVPYYQQPQEVLQDDLALGGIYEWVSTEKDFCVLTPGNFRIPKSDLIPFEEGKYSFCENDLVYFKPSCSEKEKEYLLLTNKIKPEKKYLINRIINHFFVILEDENGGETNPIKFTDISKKSF